MKNYLSNLKKSFELKTYKMISSLVYKLLNALRQTFFLLILFGVSILLAFLAYSAFYSWYVPYGTIQRQLNFQLQKSPVKILNKESMNYELIAVMNLNDETRKTLQQGQEYAVSLILHVAESEANFNIGTIS